MEEFDYIFAYGDRWSDKEILEAANERYFKFNRLD